jgi:hypothetical protein
MSLPRDSISIAKHYTPLVNQMVLDHTDEEDLENIKAMGIRCHLTKTLMSNDEDKRHLASFIIKHYLERQ